LTHIKRGPTLPTPIMYGVKIPYNSLQQMLQALDTQGLIEECSLKESSKRSKKYYRITKKGERVLINYNRILELMDPGELVPSLN
jgi:predicted transcriptional regulator